MGLASLFSGGIADDNKVLGTSSSGSTSTSTSSIDEEGLQYLLNETLSSNSGLATTTQGEHTAGVYNGATNELLTNDLLTRQAGVVASQNKTTTTDNTGTAQESPAQGIGQITVICTYFTGLGLIDSELYTRSGIVAKHRLTKQDLRGYHYWSIPVVERMKKGGILAEIYKKVFFHIADAWVRNLVGEKSFLGYITWYIMKPICTILGHTVARAPQNWERLYITREDVSAQLSLKI